MKPHKPIDLDKFNEDFFSNEKSISKDDEVKGKATEEQIFSSVKTENSQVTYTPKQAIEMLANVGKGEKSGVFHDLPEQKKHNTEELRENRINTEELGKPLVTEEEIYKSFPDVDPYALQIKQEEANNEFSEKEELKKTKNSAKELIKNEKTKIKDQKKLEKKIQKPFKARKRLIRFFILLVLIGIALSSFLVIISQAGAGRRQYLELFGKYYIAYCDGEALAENSLNKKIIFIDKTASSIQGNNKILFEYDEDYYIGSVNGYGNGTYSLSTDNFRATCTKDDVIGLVTFSIPVAQNIRSFFFGHSTVSYVIIGVYFILITGIFVIILKKKNDLIKQYRQEYDIVK